ncbi:MULTISPECIES: lysine biosynthesis protein LysW [Streptomyces]|uniref:lysine biosynthesis protein LysW n=1 Tax=Streptomyces TaxID=1883 RepID=UPI0007C86E39|nr:MULTISPECIES: lysine biosynthesis protein LysW [Streptomyces]
MSVAVCPECDAEVAVDVGTRVAEIIECGDCRVELEVIGMDPPVLSQAPEVEEDWGE